jgi:Zn-finger nucleic acid-binding protein
VDDPWRLEACGDCGGVWLTADVLQELGRCQSRVWIELGGRLAQPRRPFERRPSRPCPTCRLALEASSFSYGSSVRVDRCPACRGVWLDHGEPERIARYLATEERYLER